MLSKTQTAFRLLNFIVLNRDTEMTEDIPSHIG